MSSSPHHSPRTGRTENTNNNNNSSSRRPASAAAATKIAFGVAVNNNSSRSSSRPQSSSSSPHRHHHHQPPPLQTPLNFSTASNEGHKFSKSPLDSHASAYLSDRPGDCKSRAPGSGYYFSSVKPKSYQVANVFIRGQQQPQTSNASGAALSSSYASANNNNQQQSSSKLPSYVYTNPNGSYYLNHPESIVSGGSDARNTKEAVSKYKSKWLGGICSEGISQVAASKLSTLTRREQKLLFDTNEEYLYYCSLMKQNGIGKKSSDDFLLSTSLLSTTTSPTSNNNGDYYHSMRLQQKHEAAVAEVRQQVEADELFVKTVEQFIDQGKKRNDVEMTNRRQHHKYLVYK